MGNYNKKVFVKIVNNNISHFVAFPWHQSVSIKITSSWTKVGEWQQTVGMC